MSSDLAVQSTIPVGMEDVDGTDIAITRWSIVQPTSQEGTPGKFHNSSTGEERDRMRVTVLATRKSRTLFAEALGDDPVCKSRNARIPDPDIELPMAELCAEDLLGRLVEVCPYAQFADDKSPECQLTYNLILVDEDGVPSMMSLRKTSIKPFKAVLTYALTRKIGTYAFSVELSLSKQQNSKGSYYVLACRDFVQHSDELVTKYEALTREYTALPVD
jgi:hypothetical protein